MGDGNLYSSSASFGTFPCLEAIGWESFREDVLAVFLDNGCLFWWTTTEVLKKSALPGKKEFRLPKKVSPNLLKGILKSRCLPFQSRAWAIVTQEARDILFSWAGYDSDLPADAIILAPKKQKSWDMTIIESWVKDKTLWALPEKIVPKYARRLVIISDGDIFCVIPAKEKKKFVLNLERLAVAHGLKIIQGPCQYSTWRNFSEIGHR